MNPVFLFDIDGTLLSAKGSGRKAFGGAIETVFGIKNAVESFSFAGATDLAVLEELSNKHGFTLNTAYIEKFKHTYEAMLEETCTLNKPIPIEGSLAFIEQLKDEFRHSKVGLMTGNFRNTALVKLKHAGFAPTLNEGGFGDDHADRSQIAKIANQRLMKNPNSKTILFGDTERDAEAAKINGFLFVGLETGFTSHHTLKSLGAQMVIQNYDSPTKILNELKAYLK